MAIPLSVSTTYSLIDRLIRLIYGFEYTKFLTKVHEEYTLSFFVSLQESKNLQKPMKKFIFSVLVCSILLVSCKESKTKTAKKTTSETQSAVKISPIKHATAVIEYDGKVVYLDPTGGAEAFKNFPKPDLVFITDIHGDHMNVKTLDALDLKEATIVAPKAVADQIQIIQAKEVVVLNNGDSKSFDFLSVEAIPMYNLREEALKFHPKGRGNGYVFTIDGERIYFSGDTEDIPEMRALKDIDKAFVCMNLPYTMTVQSAASAVLEFQPKQVYPYHYRGTNGFSDVVKFKQIVNEGNKNIGVILLKWY
jgi:L-ascorbate metabolism protein UlaG (beta-lactamase superfamily)